MAEVEIWLRDGQVAVAEDFGDEVIVMNTTSGSFYSLRGRARDLWQACEQGARVADVDSALSAQDAAESQSLAEMLAEMRAAGVLATGVVDLRESGEQVPVTLGPEPAEFTKNEDFNDLVRLDPIHDVDERGWPFN